MKERLEKLLAKNPEAAKSGNKIKAVLEVIQRLRDRGLSREGYRLSSPASRRSKPMRASVTNGSRRKLTLGA
ncbi:MAG: hypothetical protein U1E21_17130 [Reyranellaceae bacterium]